MSSSNPAVFDPVSGRLSGDLPVDSTLGAVVYLSQSPHYRDVPRRAAHLWAVNVVSALTAAEWARRCGAGRFLYASSGNVYQPGFQAYQESSPVRQDDWYALSKRHGEEALARFDRDLEVTCLRFFAIYGPGQRGKLVPNLAETIRDGRPVALQPHPDDPLDLGGLKVSLTYVDDAVSVLVALASSHGPPILNVAGSEIKNVREIAEAIGERVGRSPVFDVGGPSRRGDLVADTTRLTSVWPHPMTSFEAGFDATIAELRPASA